jgi:hypothetical protein
MYQQLDTGILNMTEKYTSSIDICTILGEGTSNFCLPILSSKMKGSPPAIVCNASAARNWGSKHDENIPMASMFAPFLTRRCIISVCHFVAATWRAVCPVSSAMYQRSETEILNMTTSSIDICTILDEGTSNFCLPILSSKMKGSLPTTVCNALSARNWGSKHDKNIPIASMFAPLLSKRCIIFVSPFVAATWRAVSPILSAMYQQSDTGILNMA